MKQLRSLIALALALSCAPAFAQSNQGSSPLTGPKGGTNNAFMQFSGPTSSLKTYVLPDASDTIVTLASVQTITQAKTFAWAKLLLAGSTSGAGTLNAPAVASSYVWTLPAATDTLVGKATTDTLTNKSFDTAGAGNFLRINGILATAVTGSSNTVVMSVAPTLVAPVLGAATATSINGNVWTAGSGTLTLGAGKTATISNTLTFVGTDGSTVTLGGGGTVAYLANTLNAFAATTSAQLASVISDETGSGALVFGTAPTLVAPVLGAATATSLNKVAITPPATGATLTLPDGVTLTGPAASGTAMTLGNAETVTGVKSFNDATLLLKGVTSGATTLKAGAVAGSTVVTLPAATDTLVGKATTDTLTNKTFDTAGTGNSFAIAGLAATSNTGTGPVVRGTSPALVAPTGIVKGDVGLGNVDNTSDATKNAAVATLTNKTLTAPAISSPTGIVKGDVGLGNVDNTSDATKWAATATLTNKTFDTAGTGNSFAIAGVAATANTGTGAVVRAASPSITGTADAQGTLKLSGFVTSTQLTANANDYTATDGSNTCSTKGTLRISTNASRNITGLSCGQAEGDLRIVHNVGAFPAVLTNQDIASTAANRFLFGGDLTLAADASILLRYDGVTGRWRSAVSPGTGGGGGSGAVTIAGGAGISVSGTCTSIGTATGTCTISLAANSAAVLATPGSYSNSSTSSLMSGFGASACRITPVNSGRVMVDFAGSAVNSSSGYITTISLRYGSGSGPAAGAAATGTTNGSNFFFGNGSTTYQPPFVKSGLVTGLSPGTTYWFDLAIQNNVAANHGLSDITCRLVEF